jgi:UPF0755 protein
MTESDAPASIGVGGLRSTGHRAKPRRSRGCMPILVILVVVAAIAAFGYVKGVDFIKDQLSDSPAADYSGNGQKPIVTVTVPKGASGRDIGAVLLDAGVVKSVDAFADAYESEPKATSISYGKYELLSKMSAKSALAVLINPDSLIAAPTVTIPEGLRASEILATIAANTDFTPKQLRAAYADTEALDLPVYANGDPEGYLFPSTYDITEDTTAASLLHDMVARFTQNAEDLDLEGKAKSLGEDPGDIVTIASLVQAEAGQADMAKVASVVYNRLDAGMALQFDSTLHYGLNIRGNIQLTREQLNTDGPYNSYTRAGLPPTPIDSPGADALEAALNPASTDYLYFVTVNLATGETKFAETLEEHNQNVAEYREYCTTSDEC